jgi:hypothetical protein
VGPELFQQVPPLFGRKRLHQELLPHKPALETFLKERFGELFGIDYGLLLYDVSSTYLEGQANANHLAKRGYSRDHRPDCKQVCIGLVVTRCDLPLGYEVFVGNRHDSNTLEEIVETMEPAMARRSESGCWIAGIVCWPTVWCASWRLCSGSSWANSARRRASATNRGAYWRNSVNSAQ